jgi:SOS-response transcriptional repressor LexA
LDSPWQFFGDGEVPPNWTLPPAGVTMVAEEAARQVAEAAVRAAEAAIRAQGLGNVVGFADVLDLHGAEVPLYHWGSCGPLEGPDAAETVGTTRYSGSLDDLGPQPIAVRVRGSSMIHRDIHDGDVVFVRRQDHARPGEVVLARAWGDDREIGMVVKEFSDTQGSHLWSDGDEGHVPFPVNRFEILGVVVSTRGLRRPLTSRQSTRKRSEYRDRVSMDEVAHQFFALPAHQQRELLRRLQGQDPAPDASRPS